MPQIEVRAEERADYLRVHEILQAAFEGDSQADLVTILRESADPQISLVALLESKIVGHIFFSPITFESKHKESAVQLSPVAVDPSHQGRGVGAKLILAGLEECKFLGCSSVFLVGNPTYYARFGFTLAASTGLFIAGPLSPYLQVLKLCPDALNGVNGRVYFHPEFDSLEK